MTIARTVQDQLPLVSGTNIKTVGGTSLVGSGDVQVVTPSGTQTLSDKTLTTPTISAGYTEQVFAITGTTPTVAATNGSVQTWSLTANSTVTDGLQNGQSIVLGA